MLLYYTIYWASSKFVRVMGIPINDINKNSMCNENHQGRRFQWISRQNSAEARSNLPSDCAEGLSKAATRDLGEFRSEQLDLWPSRPQRGEMELDDIDVFNGLISCSYDSYHDVSAFPIQKMLLTKCPQCWYLYTLYTFKVHQPLRWENKWRWSKLNMVPTSIGAASSWELGGTGLPVITWGSKEKSGNGMGNRFTIIIHVNQIMLRQHWWSIIQ